MSTVLGEPVRNSIHFAASSGWSVPAEATAPFMNTALASWVLPGSTTMS